MTNEPQSYKLTLADLALPSPVTATFTYACVYHDGPRPKFPFPRLYRWSPRFLRRIVARYARAVGRRKYGPWFVDLRDEAVTLRVG